MSTHTSAHVMEVLFPVKPCKCGIQEYNDDVVRFDAHLVTGGQFADNSKPCLHLSWLTTVELAFQWLADY
jgi:hypothetical protein